MPTRKKELLTDHKGEPAPTFPFFAAAAVAPQGPQAQDFNKLFKAERDNLEFAEGLYSWVGKDIETTVLKKYSRLPDSQ